ncbi:MAG: hypothetical protein UV73_C0014G0022 [Candidatus Gottesmanbacteria bacterium GW2011_GWA2_43_14]|uniref:Aminoglycoside phosphotransferase domain-containing protein n=1 Tax=Candidatus Gottesmanbacteria bacterium GW2011_GWA2_43_14 TaxID=1618443 RepID=A0A0G1DD23_9BACT|nr:MAG: hypothetical protein UV73_C0014G0022 [Candidatus Gottesmanbacteria bacterium GW2011_GWA2_43_14]
MIKNPEKLTDFLSLDQRGGGYRFFIKSACEDHYIRRPEAEAVGYQLLSPYFRVPRAKLLKTKEGSLLVVMGKDAVAANKLLETAPEITAAAADSFINDMVEMWKDTARNLDETQIGRNWRLETGKTLERLSDDEEIQAIADFPVVVNGKTFPSLGKTLKKCESRLLWFKDPIMVLCHGDEHLGNLLIAEDGYWVVDPGNYTGYNTPASAVNNFVGGTVLFDYPYEGTANVEEGMLKVDYRIKDSHKLADSMFKPVLKKLNAAANDISLGRSSAKELLFINELRVAKGWTFRSMDLTGVLNNGMMYAGLATEHYYSQGIV